MEANELMIGDWVLVNGNPMQIQAINDIDGEIMAGDELYCLIEDRVHSEDKIEPIPLTEKILEESGFTHRNADKVLTKQSWTCECGGCTIHAKYNFGFLYFNIYGKPLKPNMFAPHVTMHIQYAHELQHTLKDCRIDKEIVL